MYGEGGTYLKRAQSLGTAATNVSIVFSGKVRHKYTFFVGTLCDQVYRRFFTGNILKCPFLKVHFFDGRMSFKHTEHVFPVRIFQSWRLLEDEVYGSLQRHGTNVP